MNNEPEKRLIFPASCQPMKVMDKTDERAMRAYLSRPVEDTHNAVELEAVHRAIRFTHLFKHDESMAKMDQEQLIEHVLPRVM